MGRPSGRRARRAPHDVEFERWANKVWNLHGGPGGESSLKDFRKDLGIEFYNEAGQLVVAYVVHRAWVSEFTALPEMDANANAIAIESLTIQHEGFERDQSVVEPAEPSSTDPE